MLADVENWEVKPWIERAPLAAIAVMCSIPSANGSMVCSRRTPEFLRHVTRCLVVGQKEMIERTLPLQSSRGQIYCTSMQSEDVAEDCNIRLLAVLWSAVAAVEKGFSPGFVNDEPGWDLGLPDDTIVLDNGLNVAEICLSAY